MPKLYYVGPRVEISHQGIYYKHAKEDKYRYLITALEILGNFNNNYEKENTYTHNFEKHELNKKELLKVLSYYKNDIEISIANEIDKYKEKIQDKITYIQNLNDLTDIDKEVWIRNIEMMKEYKIQRAINKMYYRHTIHNIIKIIQDNKIKEVTVPLNKNFFHVLNTLKGTLITGKPSFDAKVTHTYDKQNNRILRLSIR